MRRTACEVTSPRVRGVPDHIPPEFKEGEPARIRATGEIRTVERKTDFGYYILEGFEDRLFPADCLEHPGDTS